IAGFASEAGLGRSGKLCLATHFIGVPPVIGQMMTQQADLFFAATFSAGLLWLYISLRHGSPAWLAWIGIATAIGVKGTVFYMGPGLVVLGLIWLCRGKPTRRSILAQVIAAVICLVLLAAPRYVENYVNFGNPFAPDSDIERIHGEEEGGFSIEKLGLNLYSYTLDQLLPASNPPLIAETMTALLPPLVNVLPDDDPHAFTIKRKPYYESQATGNSLFGIALMGSWGILPPLLAIVGLIILIIHWKRLPSALWEITLAYACVAAVFLVIFCGLFNWSPNKFRYFLAFTPPVFLLVGLVFQRLSTKTSSLVLLVLSGLLIASFGKHITGGYFTGLNALSRPYATSVGLTILQHQRMLESEIPPSGARVAVSLPYYAPLCTFYRTGLPIHTTLIPEEKLDAFSSAEAFLKTQPFDVLITKLGRFENSPGRVHGRASNRLTGGHEKFNFVSYQLPIEGAETVGFVRERTVGMTPKKEMYVFDFHVTPTTGEPIKVLLTNPGNTPRQVRISVPHAQIGDERTVLQGKPVGLLIPAAEESFLIQMLVPGDYSGPNGSIEPIDVQFPNLNDVL
ncbi:MAG: ArnT family glycosyltransferase, partial [Puniceicoccales bacterium]